MDGNWRWSDEFETESSWNESTRGSKSCRERENGVLSFFSEHFFEVLCMIWPIETKIHHRTRYQKWTLTERDSRTIYPQFYRWIKNGTYLRCVTSIFGSLLYPLWRLVLMYFLKFRSKIQFWASILELLSLTLSLILFTYNFTTNFIQC